ncbi:MAG: hypothetical protein WBM44_26930 [Waterburya sp.]
MTKYNTFKKFAFSMIGVACLTTAFGLKPLFASSNGTHNNSSVLNWYDLWDSGSTETTRTFSNLNDSGVDVTVEYSTGQKWQQVENHNGLNLYDNYSPKKHSLNHDHNLWMYNGILRVTNNPNDTGNDSAWVKITFSESVTINQLWAGSLSTISDRREWMKVSAYNSSDVMMSNLSASVNNLVSPSKVDDYQDFFNTTCSHTTMSDNAEGHQCNLAGADDPSYIGILPNGDGSVVLKGQGNQGSQQYGRAFFEYNTPVKTIVFQHYVTDKDNENQRNSGYTSVAISPDILFNAVFAD